MIQITSGDGIRLALHHMGGEGDPLLIVHATGFSAPVYQPLADLLVQRHSVYGIDLRGQGDSDRPSSGTYDWALFGLDVLAAQQYISSVSPPDTPIFGFGHSCGAQSLLRSELILPGGFTQLYLYEPIVAPPNIAGSKEVSSPLVDLTLRRRSEFESKEEALANFRSKPPIATFTDASIVAYVESCMRDSGNGKVVLKCLREDEANIYSSMADVDTYDRLPEISTRSLIASGEVSQTFSPDYMKELASRMGECEYQMIEGADHFGPMVTPELFAELILSEFS